MRVYELAKKLGMESRILIPILNKMGINVSSHSNALDQETAQRAFDTIRRAEKGVDAESLAKSGDTIKVKPPVHEKKSGLVSHSPDSSPQRHFSFLLEEEPKKLKKKRILIKRKKIAEDVPEPVDHPLAESRDESTDEVSQGSISVTPAPEPPVPTPPPPLVVSGPQELMEGKHEGPSEISMPAAVGPIIPLHEPSVPLEEEAAALIGPEASKEESKEHKKESGRTLAKDDLEEKPKKQKKIIRGKGSDLFTARYEDSKRWQDLRPLPMLRREERVRHFQPTSSVTDITKPRKKVIKIDQGITVKDFAERLGQRPSDMIRKLMNMELVLTLNQPMDLDAGALIAEESGLSIEVVAQKGGEALFKEVLGEKSEEQRLIPRVPVVTIMGHVDHGKTSLLDAIRQTHVTNQESGGITQHIGAYSVKVGKKRVTFLDTPGHEAFTAMRARGSQITDIVVLVVAADDGVMPQTVEAIHHAQAAGVPIVVAINKIDKPGAKPDRIKQGVAEYGLVPEDWGGQTIFVEVSAKQRQGLDRLLEMILLQAEVMELKANIGCSARGVVLEAKLDRGRGPVATVLIQAGVLHVGNVFVVGATSGRVRALVSDVGTKLKEAGPSIPVEVIGLLGVPSAGDHLVVVKDERTAREIASARQQKQRMEELAVGGSRQTLDDLYARIQEGETKELFLLLKADVQGSVGALTESISKLSSDLVRFQVIHSGVGGISESDVLLAAASKALIIGFHVRPEPKAAALAEREGVEIRLYTVIYQAVDDIKAAAEGLLAPTLKERILGHAEVRQVFTLPKVGAIAGCYVLDGVISRSSAGVRLLRDQVTVYEGKVESLRRFKDDVKEVSQGYECGIGIENFNDIKIGDIIEGYVFDEEAVKL